MAKITWRERKQAKRSKRQERFIGVVREGLTGEEAFERRPEESEAVSHTAVWSKRFPGVRNRKYKYPQKGACLACSRSSREAHMAGVRGPGGR